MKNVLDVIGSPIVGPSSSHSAGATRIGLVAHQIAKASGNTITNAEIKFVGSSFAKTCIGHGTYDALVAGIHGRRPSDSSIHNPSLWDWRNIQVSPPPDKLGDVDKDIRPEYPPNAVIIRLTTRKKCGESEEIEIVGESVGGGSILISSIDGTTVHLTGTRDTLVIRGRISSAETVATQVFLFTGKDIGQIFFTRNPKEPTKFICVIELEAHNIDDVYNELRNSIGDVEISRIERLFDSERIPQNFAKIKELLSAVEGAGFSKISEWALSGEDASEIRRKLEDRLRVMWDSARTGLGDNMQTRDEGRLTGGDAFKMKNCAKHHISGNLCGTAIAVAIGIAEQNADKKCTIIPAPTAGACGILPAGILAKVFADFSWLEDDDSFSVLVNAGAIEALATAGVLGEVMSKRGMRFSGSYAGCQAECGCAAAMTAGALVELAGGNPQQVAHACAIALINQMGLVCDPVAELVEIPCVKRNAGGIMVAICAADMALAGIESLIPVDEVIDATLKVGKSIPEQLRETSEGGLATTPKGKELREQIINRRISK